MGSMETADVGHYREFLIILGVAGLVIPLFVRLGISSILGFLLVGFLLSPDVLGSLTAPFPFLEAFVLTDREAISSLGELGVVFLLFLIGLELSFERLVTMKRLVFGLGSLQVICTTALISLVAYAFAFTPAQSLVIGTALSLSSTAIVIQLYSDDKRLGSQSGRTSFAILLFQDLAVIPILLMVGVLGHESSGPVLQSLAIAIAQALLAVGLDRRCRPFRVAAVAAAGRRHKQFGFVHGGCSSYCRWHRRARKLCRPLHGAWRLYRRVDTGGNRIPPRH